MPEIEDGTLATRKLLSRIGLDLLYTFGAVFGTLALHEIGHTLVGIALGNEMAMDLNGSRPVDGRYGAPWHLPVVAASGPIVTVGQAAAGAILLRQTHDTRLYPLVLFPLLYRIVPYTLSLIQPARLGLQDEAIAAAALGVDPWLGAAVVIIPLGAIAWYATQKEAISRRRTVGIGVVSIAIAGVLILLT